jgi:hypothetical protein
VQDLQYRERPVTEQDNPEQSGTAGDPAKHRTTRRAFMVGGTAAALGAAVAGRAGGQHSITDDQARLIDKVTASGTANASLGDVKHIVILMQEKQRFLFPRGRMAPGGVCDADHRMAALA